jgi:hypothetical protein
VVPAIVTPVYRAARPRPESVADALPRAVAQRPAAAPEPLVHRPAAMPPVVYEVPPAVPPAVSPPYPVPEQVAPPPPPGPAAGEGRSDERAGSGSSRDDRAAFGWADGPPGGDPRARLSGLPGPDWPGSGSTESALSQPESTGSAERGFAPQDLADALRRMHGIDVSDVVVSRGPEAGVEARAFGARAFTRDGEVILPDEAGPVERPETRALLAHELTHAAQQRALGPGLPPPGSAAGTALEAQAVATEQRVLGSATGGAPVQPLIHPASPAGAVSWSLATGLTTAPVQRQTEEIPTSLPTGNALDPFALLPRQADQVVTGQTAETSDPQVSTVRSDAPDLELGQARTRLLELAEQRLLDLDDPVAVAELAEGIYRRVRTKLRRELLVDRERAGLLSDFR